MRLLFVTETVPWPLDSGGRIRTYHTLESLSTSNDVHLYAFARLERQRDACLEPLSRLCASVTVHVAPRTGWQTAAAVLRSLARRAPYTVQRHVVPGALRALRELAGRQPFDAVYCDHLSMLEYGRQLGLPILHDAHNVEHRIVQRYATRLGASPVRALAEREWRRLRAFEAAMYPRCAGILTVSEVDRHAIAELAGAGVPIAVVPISIDTETVQPLPIQTDSRNVLFVGPLDWPPNAEAVDWFLERVWPRVRAAVPDASFEVAGRSPHRLSVRWRSIERVSFSGWVQDIGAAFARSRVLVVPIQSGSGMRVKALDAFARGVPVVTTPVGIEGIAATHGVHCRIAAEPDSFAGEVSQLLVDDRLAAAQAAAARRLVEGQYATRVVSRCLLAALDEVMGAGLVARSAD